MDSGATVNPTLVRSDEGSLAVLTFMRVAPGMQPEGDELKQNLAEGQHAVIMVTLQANRDHEVTITARTTAEIRQLADDLGQAANNFNAAMTAAFGVEWVQIEDQLRQELGHDIGTDLGS